MPESLLERVKREKAAKAEARQAAAEQAAAEEREAALPSLKEQYESLKSQRAVLAKIKEKAARSNAKTVKGAKRRLRSERGVLREIHELSKDEDTGETAIPSPRELVNDEEFQDTTEVQRYAEAREAFRLTAAEAKEVESQLRELGIEDPSSLLPGQLEALLEEKDAELKKESVQFVIDNPEVDPEMVRELIDARTRKFELYRSSIARAAHNSVVNNRQPIERALQKALEGMQPNDASHYFSALDAITGNHPDSITALDQQALEEALIKQLIDDPLYASEMFAIEFRNNAKVLTEKAEEELREALSKKLSGSDMIRAKATGILTAYKESKKLKEIPQTIYKNSRQLETLTNAEREAASKSRVLEGNTKNYERAIAASTAELEKLQSGLATVARVKHELGAWGEASMQGSRYGYPDAKYQFDVSGEGMSYAEINAAYPHPEISGGLDEQVKSLRELTGAIRAQKDGFLGMQTKEKKRLVDLLGATMKRYYGLDSPTGVEEAEAKVQSLLAERSLRMDGREHMEREWKRKEAMLKPLSELAVMLGLKDFSGSLNDFIQSVQVAIPERLATLETQNEVNGAKKQEMVAELAELAKVLEGLVAERSKLIHENEDLEKLKNELQTKLKAAGYIQ